MLPRCEMIRTLISLINTGSSKISKMSGDVLVEVCRCASGDDGCTLAEPEEIDLLMNALTAANADLRRISLMVCITMWLLKPETMMATNNSQQQFPYLQVRFLV